MTIDIESSKLLDYDKLSLIEQCFCLKDHVFTRDVQSIIID